jgi:hypothetical protein
MMRFSRISLKRLISTENMLPDNRRVAALSSLILVKNGLELSS